MTQIFANIPTATAQLHIDLWDVDEEGFAVWRVRVNEDIRFIEGRYDDEVWTIVNRAAAAYEE